MVQALPCPCVHRARRRQPHGCLQASIWYVHHTSILQCEGHANWRRTSLEWPFRVDSWKEMRGMPTPPYRGGAVVKIVRAVCVKEIQ